MQADLPEILPDLPLFVAVARARSFSGAAKLVRVPVSTLSRRVAELEERLGVQLLHRTTRQVTLTPAGARFFERSEALVEAAEAARAELLGEGEAPQGVLRLAATQDVASLHLAPVLQDFARRHPAISLELDLSPRAVDLVAEGVDVAIRMGPLADSQLVARRLGSMSAGLYAAPAYLAAAGEPARPADLAGHDCLRLRGDVAGATRWTLHGEGQVEVVAVRGRVVANSMRVLLDFAEGGFGVAMLDDAVVREALAAGRVVRVLSGWTPAPVPVHALTPTRLLPARTRLFLEHLRDHLACRSLPDPR